MLLESNVDVNGSQIALKRFKGQICEWVELFHSVYKVYFSPVK